MVLLSLSKNVPDPIKIYYRRHIQSISTRNQSH